MAGINRVKKRENYFEFRKTTRVSKYNKKLVVDDKEIKDQTFILGHIREFHETLQNTGTKTAIEMEKISLMLIFQNSLKIKKNFVRKI